MKKIFFLFLLFSLFVKAQEGFVYGTITDELGNKLSDVHIRNGKKTYVSDGNGGYNISIPLNKKIKLVFSSISFNTVTKNIFLSDDNPLKIDVILKNKNEFIDEITLTEEKDGRLETIDEIKTKDIKKIAGVNQGVEGLIRSLSASTTSNNELSSQYSVRGGNFDENLVYVNGLEIYRPFLVRSGKQEGLSFINSDMVESIRFSAGGFSAEFGDKLSSVLDITYKKADSLSLKSNFSFQGVGLTIENPFKIKDKTLSFVGSYRFKSPSFILKSLDTEADYRPRFSDAQVYLDYPLDGTSNLSFLGNYSKNTYNYVPTTRTSSFGTLQESKQLVVYFEGQEVDEYENANLALKWEKYINENAKISFQGTHFRTLEQEFYDINGQYILGVTDNNPGSDNYGNISQVSGVGEYLNHARNQFYGKVSKLNHRGELYNTKQNSTLKWGLDYQRDNVDDRLDEWTYLDSLGFNTNDATANLMLDKKVFAKNSVTSNRMYGFVQYSDKNYNSDRNEYWSYTAGLRGNYWSYNKEFFITPRASVSYKPDWEKDMVFKFTAGKYNQSPFYREMRDFKGNLNQNIQSQKSFQTTLSNNYNLKMFGRPFKMSTELYYKNLWDVIPYEIENLQVKYYAQNNAKAYSAGLEWRLNGEIVKGAQSYVSMALMKTAEDIENDNYGFIPKPTDRRFSVSLFYQDHINKNENIRFSLAASYATGLPYGANDSERGEQTFRIPSYRRVDIAFSKALKKEFDRPNNFSKHFKSIWVSVEVLNLLAINNTQSYLWVKDALQQEFAVPNYLTGRLINLKLSAEL